MMDQLIIPKALELDFTSAHTFVGMAVHLAVASLLASLIAFRPWRRLLRHTTPPRREMAQAHTLTAAAAALTVAIIGNSVARAFGLVGLGAFLRFRTGIKDQRDAAVVFIMIGIGMACGSGMLLAATVAALLFAAVLVVFDVATRPQPGRARIAVTVNDARAAFPTIQSTFPGARTLAIPQTRPEPGTVVLELSTKPEVDAAAVLRMLRDGGVPGVLSVTLESDEPRA